MTVLSVMRVSVWVRVYSRIKATHQLLSKCAPMQFNYVTWSFITCFEMRYKFHLYTMSCISLTGVGNTNLEQLSTLWQLKVLGLLESRQAVVVREDTS